MRDRIKNKLARVDDRYLSGRLRRALHAARHSSDLVSLFARRDVPLLMRLVACTGIAWLVSERKWAAFVRRVRRLGVDPLADVGMKLHEHDLEHSEVTIRRVLEELGDEVSPAVLREQLEARDIEEILQILRSHRPGGWHPTLTISGTQQIEDARTRGNGVILWVADFASSSLVTKLGLHEAGVDVHHFSVPTHGFATTPVGIRLLNPIWTSVENRYLASRITMGVDNRVAALRTLRRCLNANRVVSITDTDTAQRKMMVPFLGRRREYAPGAPSLAMATGAPILPVVTVRISLRNYEINVLPALDPPDTEDKRSGIDALVRKYSSVLETYVRRYPGLWRRWIKLMD